MPSETKTLSNFYQDSDNKYAGVKFVIKVNSQISENKRTYVFSDNLYTLFDIFEINSYIKGVSLDGTNISPSMEMLTAHPLERGFHNFTLRMSDHAADTSVTYKANGGAFADGSDSMSLDATYGEPLPLVEAPKASDEKYTFDGWFTEPEDGVEVDPANYQ